MERLDAERSVSTWTLPAGFTATVFAAEPDVRQPIAMTFDERGRLWIAENYTYAERGVRFASDLRDRVLIFADADHDGRFDTRKVFWDRGRKLTSIEVGFGGIWALCAPELLFIPDQDGDDVPDAEPAVLLDGWDEDSVHHNIVNGLRWGPDGWLYGRHGIQATSRVGPPGSPPDARTAINCGVWRFHPLRRTFEVVAHGTTNSWGHDWDDHGELVFINTVIGHLWHAVPGAHFERMYGEDFNPHLYELIPQTADHYHWDTRETWSDVRKLGVTETSSLAGGGHAHSGLMIYLGDNWPEAYRGDVFALNFHGRRLNRDRLERRGAGYVATHRPDVFAVGEPWFRGIDLAYGPDGGVYVLDWSDIGECHEQDGVHRNSGRVFKVVHGTPAAPGAGDLAARTSEDLVRLQLHRNDWWVRQARRILQERSAAGDDMAPVHEALRAIFREHDDVTRKLRALWCLYVTGGTEESWLLEQLAHPAEYVRVWAVRLLVDGRAPSAGARAALTRLARGEESGPVLLYLASALQRLALTDRWELAAELVTRAVFASDPVFPRMIWYGIEPAVARYPERAAALAETSRVPQLRRFIARRLTSELHAEPASLDPLLALLESDAEPAFRLAVLAGMREALLGAKRASAPRAWSDVGPALYAAPDAAVARHARTLGAVFGDAAAAGALRALLVDPAAPAEDRSHALEALVQVRAEGLGATLRSLVDSPLAVEAIRGLAALGDTEAPPLLVAAYDGLSLPARAEAIRALSSRPATARVLLDAIAAGAIARDDVPAFEVRQMRSFDDAEIRALLDRHWPELRPLAREKAATIGRYRERLAAGALAEADLAAGREHFLRLCSACHKLLGDGADVGPDLTGSNRNNLDYLLINLVDPSGEVARDFRISVIILADGRVLNGVVGADTGRTVSVVTPTERLLIEKDSIVAIEPTGESLMPEGLLDTLGENAVRDLIGYLQKAGAGGAH